MLLVLLTTTSLLVNDALQANAAVENGLVAEGKASIKVRHDMAIIAFDVEVEDSAEADCIAKLNTTTGDLFKMLHNLGFTQ
ncbi:MAG TPA: hypothetical protein PKD90_03325 [Phnomibacter sp.]|nr:hypothetical protein [Phnomibacter sp.]